MKKKLLSLVFSLGCIIGVSAQNVSVQDLYKSTDKNYLDATTKNSPLIGVSASRANRGGSAVPGTYIEAILKAGGIPIVVPVMTDSKVLGSIVEKLDGLVMTGGEDFNPSYYNESLIPDINEIDSVRDIYDLTLLKLATDRNIPVLGICRGEQAINVGFGGKLYQDIPLQHKDSSVKHRQSLPFEEGSHKVSISENSKLFDVLGQSEALVNSFHHQGVMQVAPNFRVVATAQDGIVEAIEAYPNRSILGVQWHPEGHVYGGDVLMLKIFNHIVKQATLYKQAKELHARILSVDTHCDTPLEFKHPDFNIGNREANQVNIPKMQEGYLDAIFFAAYIGQGARDAKSSQQAVDRIDGLIDGIYDQASKNKDVCGIAYSVDDLVRLKAEGKKAIFIGIENAYGIGKDIHNIARFKERGVNYITLCHTKPNDICDSSSDKAEWGGLSNFGKDVIQEMNRLGILIDISHASEKTFYDVIQLSKHPIIASHSSVKALCDHDRNLTDDQMRAIAQKGGVVQICLVDLFINKDKDKASIMDAIDHIDYAIKIAGIDHVGIASDFDGGGGLIGCSGSNDMINITMKLIERGYSEEDIAKIWGGNFLRVLSTVQGVR